MSPTAGSVLLDTNAVIALFARERPLEEALSRAAEVFLPSIALGELFYGAHKSEQVEKNLARIRTFVAASVVLACDTRTAEIYGLLKNQLRSKGRPIPQNDVWIAALAMQYQLAPFTRDGHFRHLEGLRTISW